MLKTIRRARGVTFAPLTSLPLDEQKPPYRIKIKFHFSPGDTLVMTAAIRSLKKHHGDKYRVAVDMTAHQEIFANNPDLETFTDDEVPYVVRLKLPFCNTPDDGPTHFITSCCENLGASIQDPFPDSVRKPILHLSEQEAGAVVPWSKYVVLVAGYKADTPIKYAGRFIFQQVADFLNDQGLTVVQVGSADDVHERLDGVVDMIGKTTIRGLAAIINKCEFTISGITLAQHLAAALDKPAIVMGGGRESVWLTAYARQHYLHTLGLLPCCSGGGHGCWKWNFEKSEKGCSLPVIQPDGQTVPRCHQMVGAEGIITAARRIIASLHTANE